MSAKILLINGSPHQHGSTAAALQIIADRLTTQGCTPEIFWLGNRPVQDCVACGGCVGKGTCVFTADPVNDLIAKAATADALVVASPVYYAHPTGQLLAALDRAFYAGKNNFRHKPAAAVAVARRAGTTATLDVLNKYFTINEMPVVSSTYWNQAFARVPADLPQDAEGGQTLTNLADNLAWLVHALAAAQAHGVTPPATTSPVRTNFIR